MFDLFLYPLHFAAGREQPDLPGLFATAAPRRAERHRAADQLAVLLTPTAGAPRAEGLAEAFQLLSTAYFSTGGTVTTAIRAAIDRLNEALLAKKIQASSESGAALRLNLVVLRGSLVYFAHSGVTHSYLFGKVSAQDLTDPHSAGSGLGVTRAAGLRLFQSEIEPGDLLVLCAQPPPAWTPAALHSGQPATPDGLRARLLASPPQNLSAGMIALQNGSGAVQRVLTPVEAVISVPAPAPAHPSQPPALPLSDTPEEPAPLPPITAPVIAPAIPTPLPAAVLSNPIETAPVAAAPVTQPTDAPVEGIYLSGERLIDTSAERSGTARERREAALRARPGLKERIGKWFARKPAAPTVVLDPELEQDAESFAPPLTPQPAPRPANKTWARGAAGMVRNVQTAQQTARRGLARFLPRLAPGPAAQPIAISTASLLFIAIAVPVIIVAIATTVYLQAGVGEERVTFLQQARIASEQAMAQKDITLRHNAWEQTMYWIKKAEAYGSDDESQALREKAQAALDSMDGIVRLSLVPAFTGILGNQVNITRMAASGNNLYLLDSSQGRVMRMIQSGRGYEFDPNFSCGPGPSGEKIINALVGMALLPPGNSQNALVMAIDGAGNLLYCMEDDPPKAATLIPPDNNWGKISTMSVSDGNLHLVDIPNNGVYRYDGVGYTYSGEDRPFFGNIVPVLSDVIDMAAYLDDLYLLHENGTMTVCTWSDFELTPTRCTDPASYGDSRQEGAIPSFADARFLQMATTQPPDPSLFILDTSGPSIYHFSLRLNLQRQLRQDTASEFQLPNKTATAFAVSASRVVFIAFGNEVFFGPLP